MANEEVGALLARIPIEVRHNIFKYTAASDVEPKNLLRYWFEKKEVKELVAQHVASDPNGPAPQVVYNNVYEEDSHVFDQGDEDEHDDSAENDNDDEDGHDDEELNSDDDDDDDEEGEADSNENEDGHAHAQAQGTSQSLISQAPVAVQAPPPVGPVICPATKWCYIPLLMRFTHRPPPVELLLTCKQLNYEAKNWFYDVAMLQIHATGSFAHTSFFEEALSQIADAAFSPVENVRKVAVMFVWDTTWLRAESTGTAAAIFPALLRQRATFVHQILLRAPDLKEVTITWHDSAQDDESANFMLDTLEPFHTLNAQVTIKEHYIAADAKPYEHSIAGKRRTEFQTILDAGLHRLF
jgi:hypothetical protein